MYAGTAYGSPVGTAPSQTISDLAIDPGGNLFALVEAPDYTHKRLTRINPDTMKVTGELLDPAYPPTTTQFGNDGVINRVTGKTIVAYQGAHAINSQVYGSPRIFDGTAMTFLGYGPLPGYTNNTAGGTALAAGAQGPNPDGSCDFWMVNTDWNGHSCNFDIWCLHVAAGGGITSTKTATVNALSLYPAAPNLYVPQLNWDTAHGCLLLVLSDNPARLNLHGMSVRTDGTVNWTDTWPGGGDYGKGQSRTDNPWALVDNGTDAFMVDTSTGTYADLGPTLNVNPYSHEVFDSVLTRYWTFSLGVGAVMLDFTMASPGGSRCGSATDTSIRPTWDAVAGATSYALRWRPAGGSTWTTVSGIGVTSWTITGLAASTSYEWQVATGFSGYLSAWSASATCATTASTTVSIRRALLRKPSQMFIGP
jgi:hypothetical protein